MTSGFTGFMNSANAELNWYTFDEFNERIKANDPDIPWFRLVLLEAMLFEPYFPLTTKTDKKGNEVPSNKYSSVNTPISGYKKSDGDKFLDDVFAVNYHLTGYIKRLRKSYDKVCRELNEVLKTAITSINLNVFIRD